MPSSTRRPERRGVVDLGAEIGVECVGVGVEMHGAEGLALGEAAQDRQRDRVIAAGGDRRDLVLGEVLEERRDPIHAAQKIERIDGRVAHVRDVAEAKRRDAGWWR